MAGTLFVVATPIGNLEDLTFRALRTLREVDLIAAEDTRRTAKLLAHYEIQKSMVSLHEHNEYREAPRLVARLLQGESIALVSDAGTPGIADPGARLVRAARDASVAVIPIPGPSAITAALSVAGIASSEFVFAGFAPAKAGARRRWLGDLSVEQRTIVFFETPHRIAACIEDMSDVLVERQIDIAREITKINFEFVKKPTLSTVKTIGEFVVVIHPTPDRPIRDDEAMLASLIFGLLTETIGIDSRTAELAAAVGAGISQSRSADAIRLGNKLVKKQKMTQA